MAKVGLLERLNRGEVIIGDGGFLFALERRGYVQAGSWTPEVTIEHPQAVKNLHQEFKRAGADVMQTFTFYSSRLKGDSFSANSQAINDAACAIASEAAEGAALVAGNIAGSVHYTDSNYSKAEVVEEFRSQLESFQNHNVDFLIIELVEYIEQMEWILEVCKESEFPIVACMCIGPSGDVSGVSAGECAVRMVRAGADAIGTNCRFGPEECLKTLKLMKEALNHEQLTSYLVAQPVGFYTPDVGILGLAAQPEYPFALEPRTLTRFEVQKWTRKAYNMGVRYIGGCCGFEPYHIRAIAEELATERGGLLPEASQKHGLWGSSLNKARKNKPWILDRANKTYWEKLIPATGRPQSSAFSDVDPRSAQTVARRRSILLHDLDNMHCFSVPEIPVTNEQSKRGLNEPKQQKQVTMDTSNELEIERSAFKCPIHSSNDTRDQTRLESQTLEKQQLEQDGLQAELTQNEPPGNELIETVKKQIDPSQLCYGCGGPIDESPKNTQQSQEQQ